MSPALAGRFSIIAPPGKPKEASSYLQLYQFNMKCYKAQTSCTLFKCRKHLAYSNFMSFKWAACKLSSLAENTPFLPPLSLLKCEKIQGPKNDRASQVALVVKNLPAYAGDIRDADSIPGLGRSLGGRTWQPTPVFLPGESYGQRSLAGYSL